MLVNCTISSKFLTVKHRLQNKRYLRNFLKHMRTHLKCYLNCLWLYKNQILEQLLSGNIMDSLIVKQLCLGSVLQAFGPTIEGFKSCRPIISVNDTHLYKRFSRKLLIAVAFDTDNEIFSLAYAPIEEENNVNWRWFSLLIQHHITGDLSGICIISDRHVSIKHEMTTV